MGIRYKILQDMKRDRVIANYESKDRLIAPALYKELKGKKKCGHCGKRFNGQVPEIHHKVPVSKGGSNDSINLIAVHHRCHKELDEGGI